MFKKHRTGILCILTAVIVIVGSLAVVLFNQKDKAKPAVNNNNTAAVITDISSYHKKISVTDNHLPSSEIINQGGNGLQLYDTQGNFINGDVSLDCKTGLNTFLRVIWLENQESDLSLVVLVDNHIQPFQVDDKQDQQTMLNFSMQPKSMVNIPLSVDAIGDKTIENSTITFLLLFHDSRMNISNDLPLPNATNSLSYKITNLQKKDFKDSTLVAKNFINQNDTNAQFIKSKGFYSVLSSKSNDNFTFYQEKQKLNIDNTNCHFYAMGLGSRTTFMLIGDKLISPFENKAYLTYALNDKTYLKQKVSIDSDYKSDDRLTIIHMEQNTPPRYTVDCHSLIKY